MIPLPAWRLGQSNHRPGIPTVSTAVPLHSARAVRDRYPRLHRRRHYPMIEAQPVSTIKPTDLPTPPHAALRICHACADPKVTSGQLARLIGNDPVLTAELLRIVNSPFFGVSRKIPTVPRAVTVLGQRALRNLALCLSVRDALKPHTIPGFDPAAYWEDALRRAVSARLVAKTVGTEPEECFTAGLLLDFGLLAMLNAMPHQVGHWAALRAADPRERYQMEAEIFGTTHDQVGFMLARAWGLPEALAATLSQHHACPESDPAPTIDPRLCRIAAAADWMAAVFSAREKQRTIENCRRLLRDRLDIGTKQCDELLERTSEDVEQAADALGLRIAEPVKFEDIVHASNRRLAEENLSYQDLTWRLEKTLGELEKVLEERDRLAGELQTELELAREIQRSLLPKPAGAAFPITGLNIPAGEVSGDFYDYFVLEDGRICFNLADVSGKGMNAALLMAKTCSLFRCLGKTIHDPAPLMSLINTELCETSVRGMFVTMVGGIYDPRSGVVRLVNAGHQPPLHVDCSGRCTEFEATAPPLGIAPEIAFSETELRLDGGHLYIYTDGLSEFHSEDRRQPDHHELARMLSRLAGIDPLRPLDRLLAEITASDRSPQDDLTVLVISAAHDIRGASGGPRRNAISEANLR